MLLGFQIACGIFLFLLFVQAMEPIINFIFECIGSIFLNKKINSKISKSLAIKRMDKSLD